MITEVTVRVNRKTGEIISKETTRVQDVTEDRFYQPLIEVFHKSFMETQSQ